MKANHITVSASNETYRKYIDLMEKGMLFLDFEESLEIEIMIGWSEYVNKNELREEDYIRGELVVEKAGDGTESYSRTYRHKDVEDTTEDPYIYDNITV